MHDLPVYRRPSLACNPLINHQACLVLFPVTNQRVDLPVALLVNHRYVLQANLRQFLVVSLLRSHRNYQQLHLLCSQRFNRHVVLLAGRPEYRLVNPPLCPAFNLLPVLLCYPLPSPILILLCSLLLGPRIIRPHNRLRYLAVSRHVNPLEAQHLSLLINHRLVPVRDLLINPYTSPPLGLHGNLLTGLRVNRLVVRHINPVLNQARNRPYRNTHFQNQLYQTILVFPLLVTNERLRLLCPTFTLFPSLVELVWVFN